MVQAQWQQSAARGAQLTEIAIRGAATLFDLQMQTARDMLAMHARSAGALGLPDFSPFFVPTADEQARRVFSESANEIVNTTRRTIETVAEVNRQFGRLIEQQTVNLSDTMRAGIDQLGRHAEQGLEQARTVVERGVDELARMSRDGKQQAETNIAVATEASRRK